MGELAFSPPPRAARAGNPDTARPVSVRLSVALTRLLPASAFAYESDLQPPWPGSSTPRESEFLAGRACAQAALHPLGVDATVGRHPDRSPIWPQGTVGSISHCQHLAVAAAASQASLLGLGVDVEEAADLAAELRTILFTAKELAMLTGSNDDRLAGILFSLKESAFKCWYPTSRTFLDYTDVEVSQDLPTGYFTADVIGPRRSRHPAPVVQGRFMIHFGHIFSAAWIENP